MPTSWIDVLQNQKQAVVLAPSPVLQNKGLIRMLNTTTTGLFLFGFQRHVSTRVRYGSGPHDFPPQRPTRRSINSRPIQQTLPWIALKSN